MKHRLIHAGSRLHVVKPYLLADIGEGIREVQIIQWFVKPGARVEQFQALCEVQSDKAVTEITSRFDGVVKKLHYEADDMAQVGKPLVDIDIQSEISAADEALTTPPEEKNKPDVPLAQDTPSEDSTAEGQPAKPDQHEARILEDRIDAMSSTGVERGSGKHQTLATPAVRRLTKEMNVNIADVKGTGKEGRVLKEDVVNHVNTQQQGHTTSNLRSSYEPLPQEDRTVPLTPLQSQMLKLMTKSLQIPHFLYSDTLDFTSLTKARQSLNVKRQKDPTWPKISALAFILKAVSLALTQYPLLNARLDVNSEKPQLHYRTQHNLGIAVDTPQGLLVPVVKSIQSLSIIDIAAEISRLSSLGRDGKLSSADLSGGTFTVSNVGSIGGGVVSPVIVEGQSGILGVGRAKVMPAFDEFDNVIKREECVFSWSADHRFVDGATVARAAEVVKTYLESPAEMVLRMR